MMPEYQARRKSKGRDYGQTSSLLGLSANCPPGSNLDRQTDHGIQSGCE